MRMQFTCDMQLTCDIQDPRYGRPGMKRRLEARDRENTCILFHFQEPTPRKKGLFHVCQVRELRIPGTSSG
jgi:hypothetical protein